MNYSAAHTDLNTTNSRPAITAFHIDQLLKTEPAKPRTEKHVLTISHEKKASTVFEMKSFTASDPIRKDLGAFIQDVFFHHHKAVLTTYMPKLLASFNENQVLQSAVGIREIDSKPLFLEQYLDLPIEQVVSKLSDHNVSRHQIAEVGNLASVSAGSSRYLILTLVHYFSEQSIEWAVCTGTSAVRAVLTRLGIPYSVIQEANPERLTSNQDSWGTYYRHNPFVIAIDIQTAMKIVSKNCKYQRTVS